MHQHKVDMTTFPATKRAAARAYRDGGRHAPQIDVAEVHDCFTGVELISYEDLGFAERFEGYKLVEAHDTSVGGRIPVNPVGRAQGQGAPARAPPGWPSASSSSSSSEARPPTRSTGATLALAHNIGGPDGGLGGDHPGLREALSGTPGGTGHFVPRGART